MLFTAFDIETTGFSGTFDSVIQFAYVTVDSRMQPIRSGNLYLYDDKMTWSLEAERVHGLSKAFLREHAGDYDKTLCLMYSLLHRGNLIGHNIKRFDVPFVSEFLSERGSGKVIPFCNFDTMQIWRTVFGKQMKLVELPGKIGISEYDIISLTENLFGDKAGELRPHDACYDTVASLLCLKEAVGRGMCTLVP